MKNTLAFVLGGGGARGAMQVGALRAILETGLQPDLLVGTSIGAVNALALALWGVDAAGLQRLEQTYEKIAASGLMDPRVAQFVLTAISGRPNHRGSRLVREFLIAEGITPDIRFRDLAGVRLGMVGTDLHTGKTIIYGRDPDDRIIDGVMASTAIPPWFAPVDLVGHSVIDGGVVSGLPIEPAMELGATEIIALDLNEPDAHPTADRSATWYLDKIMKASAQREIDLELALARARGVPVHYLSLRSSPPVELWDFAGYRRLTELGYDLARRELPRGITRALRSRFTPLQERLQRLPFFRKPIASARIAGSGLSNSKVVSGGTQR